MVALAAAEAPTRLERFAAELEAIHEAEKQQVTTADAHAMERLVGLARVCEERGRRLIATSWNPVRYARGVWLLASHYIMEFTNGHAVSHGIYDDIPGSRLDSATYEWRTGVVGTDEAVAHNQSHHPFTNQAGIDHDLGFLTLRLSGRTPWRPWHLIQLVTFLVIPLAFTLYLPGYLAAARARFERRPVWTRTTFGPAWRKVRAQWWQNYVRAPARAGLRFPLVLVGNFAAKLISNVYLALFIAVDHHAPEVVDFEPDPDEPKEVFYLRQILATRNFHVGRRHEDRYMLGVNMHIEHHLFPDLPVHRLRRVEAEVRSLCAAYGIPHHSSSWGRAIGGTIASVLIYSLPVRSTPARRRGTSIFTALAEELRAARRARARRPAPVVPATIHRVRLARSGRELSVSSRQTLLEALEAHGIQPLFGCRKGACKTCVVKKLAGRTTLEKHRVRDVIELCVARPASDVDLDL